MKRKYTWVILMIWFLHTGYFSSVYTKSNNCGKIAFVSDRDSMSQLFVIDADGSNLTQITADYSYNVEPSWSPDGKKIVFTRGFWDYDIYVMDPDGSNVKQLTRDRQINRAPVVP